MDELETKEGTRIEFEVRCAQCGDALEVEEVVDGKYAPVPKIKVNPCSRCVEDEYHSGYADGREE